MKKMKNIALIIYATILIGFSMFCLTQGNPAWLVGAGFVNWVLPTILLLMGLMFGTVGLVKLWPASNHTD